jgi:RNA polymerase sigma-32 factor
MTSVSLPISRLSKVPFEKKGTALIPQMPVLPSGGVGNLDSYISAVNQMPMLTADEEIEFATRLKNDNDLESARRLILSHLRLVVSISRQYLGYGLPHSDLIQEGNVGLMKAVKRFDVTQGVRLVSYAIFWIKAEIHEFILKNWRLVRVATTKPQRKLFFNLRSNKPTLNALSTDEVNELAKALDVNQSDVREMEIRLGGSDVSLEIENEDGEFREQGTWMSDSSLEPTHVLMQEEDMQQEVDGIQRALAGLDERSRHIIQSRWLPNQTGGEALTLHELADELKISAERVRQLESAALKKCAQHSVLNS